MMSEAEAPEAEAPVLTPETGAEQPTIDASDDADAEVEAEALAMGWKPQSSYKGPADKFVSAAEYVERGKTIMPFLRNELKRRDREIEGLKKAAEASIKYISRADERAYTKAKADLEAELAQFAEAGDKVNVKAVTDDLIALEKDRFEPAAEEAPSEHPDFTAWRDTNEWYGKDKPLSAAFDAICAELGAEGFPPKAGLKEATRRIKEEFPAKFAKPTNPNRTLPGAVEAGGQSRVRGGKTYSDLPADAKAMCDDMCASLKGMTREKYVKSYFEDEK
jgi:hypothetical protein